MSQAPTLPTPDLAQGWAERSRQAVWHPCTQMKVHEHLPPRPIVQAQGPAVVGITVAGLRDAADRCELTADDPCVLATRDFIAQPTVTPVAWRQA